MPDLVDDSASSVCEFAYELADADGLVVQNKDVAGGRDGVLRQAEDFEVFGGHERNLTG